MTCSGAENSVITVNVEARGKEGGRSRRTNMQYKMVHLCCHPYCIHFFLNSAAEARFSIFYPYYPAIYTNVNKS